MDKKEWIVEGMTCTTCALNVSKYLEKEGLKQVKVNPMSGDVSFVSNESFEEASIKSGIDRLGYKVVSTEGTKPKTNGSHHGDDHGSASGFLNTNKKRFLFTLPFTAILLLHMLHGVLPHQISEWLMNPWVQLALCLPVFIVGMSYFGKSAYKSLRSGMPNMDVLITIGSLAAFIYSVVGSLILKLGHDYLFFETSATIITLVFLGNALEEASINATQKELNKLGEAQDVKANMIAFDENHREQIFEVDSEVLKSGDLILVRTGEQVPADAKILWGECTVNEAILTGESEPIFKQKKDMVTGGSVLESGSIKAQVTAAGKDTVLSGIIKMVKDAQTEKPPMQRKADRISARFVPAVLTISLITFIGNYLYGHAVGESLMRSIAVLVISCPCAMGLATPAAIAVGMGRAARNGILFRNASALEFFKDIKQIVFDKTGTLTTGKFSLQKFETTLPEEEFKRIVFSLEKFSVHPLAQPIINEWKTNDAIRWDKIEEIKGRGMRGQTPEGDVYEAGSHAVLGKAYNGEVHNIFLTKNGSFIGWVDVADEVRPEAVEVLAYLRSKGIKTIMLTGDKKEKADVIGRQLGIAEVISEQSPAQKLDMISTLDKQAPTAMVGDGVNDAPALSKASLGISLSDASQLAVQSADVILMNSGLKKLPLALGLGKHTYKTINENLFWAFAYNVVAIPVAAFGFLSATFAAFAMAGSDVVLALNSLRLFVKNVKR